MLIQILMVMGFDGFDFWRSDMLEAANTWAYGENQEQVGLSPNIVCIKKRPPLFDVENLYSRIRNHEIEQAFPVLVRELLAAENRLSEIAEIDAVLFRRINHKYLHEAYMARHWEAKYRELEGQIKG